MPFCPSLRLEVMAKWPSVKGLGFRKTLQQSNQRVSLFFITTDSSVHVRLQAPRQQFESLGLETKIVENFGARVKEILNGFSAPIEKVDTEAFMNALDDFITDLDEQEEK
jgi:intergrase/recombinase